MARIILRDGKVADFREASDCDLDRQILRELFSRVSPESLYFRFFHAVRYVSESFIDSLLNKASDIFTLLCVAGETLLGVGTYTRQGDHTAEVAFMVDDRLHGKGIGTLLLEHLAEHAWANGITQFVAYILEDNYKMIQVFTTSGYEVKSKHDSGMIQLALPLVKTERIRALQEMREKMASAASLEPFFKPETVAVVGASRDMEGLGHQLFRHVLDGDFAQVVYPINRHARSIGGVRAYPRLTEAPEAVDLAVLVVPADQTMAVIDDCIEANVRAVMITSSGFSDQSKEGQELEREIVTKLRAHGIRLIGPNSLGILNATDAIRLNASFVPEFPARGKLSIASQSGALGMAILGYATRIGVGIAHFVSMGNKADVSGNDLLQYWEDDTDTEMIVLYLESFGNPRKFSRIARRITRVKPILVVKGGRTIGGASVSQARGRIFGHQDMFIEALFDQAGIIRLDSLPELFDVAAFLAHQPLPQGRRVAILTNTAGGAVMAVDALAQQGLELVHAPVDLGFEQLAQGYRTVLPQLLRDPAVDAVMVIYVSIGSTDAVEVMNAVAQAIHEADTSLTVKDGSGRKPVVANFLTTADQGVRILDATSRKVPVYPFPEQACKALKKAIVYAEYLTTQRGHEPDLESVEGEKAREFVRSSQALEDGLLDHQVAYAALTAVGIDLLSIPLLPFTIRIELDRSFGMMFGITAGAMRSITSAQLIRLLPLTDLDVAEILQFIEKNGMVLEENDKERISHLFFALSRLIDEVPDISGLVIDDKGEIQLYKAVDN